MNRVSVRRQLQYSRNSKQKMNDLYGIAENMTESGKLICKVIGPFIYSGGTTLHITAFVVLDQKQIRQRASLTKQFVLFNVGKEFRMGIVSIFCIWKG